MKFSFRSRRKFSQRFITPLTYTTRTLSISETLVYIDIQSWAEAKATHIDVVEIIRQKVKNRKL